MDDTGAYDGPRRLRPARLVPLVALSLAALVAVAPPAAAADGDGPARLPAADEPAFPASPLEQPLADVRIEGNVTIAASAVSQHIKCRPGRPATDAMIRDDIKALYATRWFLSIEPILRPGDDGPVLTFRVAERPIVRKITYDGNNKIATKHLAALTGLKPGSPYDPNTNREAAQRIEAHYREKGYAFAKVTLAKGDSPEDREVVFKIVEGAIVRVDTIHFKGNSFVSGQLLATKIQTEKMWWPLPFRGKYDPTSIPNDVAALKEYYQGLGFFDVAVKEDVSFHKEDSRVHITYTITEGDRYKVTDVRYEGNKIFGEETLSADRTLKPGDYFNERFLNKDLEKMRDLYGETGRLYAKVAPETIYSERPGETVLVYKIDEDRVYYIRDINVHIAGDNPHTKTNVLRNYIWIAPGNLADPKKINRAKLRAEGSQIFERGEVGIDIKPVGMQFAEEDEPTFRGQSPGPYDEPAAPYLPAAGQPGSARVYRDPNPYVAPPAAAPSAGYVPEMSRPVRTPPVGSPSVRVAAAPPVAASPSYGQYAANEYAGGGYTGSYTTAPQPAGPAVPEPPFTDPFDPQPARTADAVVDPYETAQIEPQGGSAYGGPLGNPSPFIPTSPQGNPLIDYMDGPPPGFVDLDVRATEARTGRLMIGAGVNSSSGVIGNFVLSEDNFDIMRPPTSWNDVVNGTAWRGAGQRFRLEAQPGNVVSRYLVSLSDPYFLDTDYSVGGSAFYFQRYYPSWNERRAGGRINVGRQLSPFLSVSSFLRIEDVNIYNPATPTPADLQRYVGDSFLLIPGVSAQHDTRDSPLLPSEGHFVDGTFSYGVEPASFARFDLDATQFFTLYSRPDGTGKHILSVGGQFGYTGNDTPIYERYFAGGFSSLRGFRYRGVGPRENGINVGGDFLLAGSLQYMFPLLANDSLHGVVFTDAGTVNPDVSLSNFRVSVGTGLRISIPALGPAPLAFDFAIPVAKADGDQTQIFQFYVGAQR